MFTKMVYKNNHILIPYHEIKGRAKLALCIMLIIFYLFIHIE